MTDMIMQTSFKAWGEQEAGAAMEVLMAESCAQPGAEKPLVAFVGATLDRSLTHMATQMV